MALSGRYTVLCLSCGDLATMLGSTVSIMFHLSSDNDLAGGCLASVPNPFIDQSGSPWVVRLLMMTPSGE